MRLNDLVANIQLNGSRFREVSYSNYNRSSYDLKSYDDCSSDNCDCFDGDCYCTDCNEGSDCSDD